MILILLFVGIFVFIGGLLLMPTKATRLITGAIGLLLLSTMAILMIGNDNWHWGMHQTTTTSTVNIRSMSPDKRLGLLVYQPIRQSKDERVYVYKDANAAQQHTTASLKISNHVSFKSTKQAQLTTKRTYWAYNQHWQWLFKWTGSRHKLIRRQNTFVLPETWTTLSSAQAKWLSTAVKTKEAAAKLKLQKQVAVAFKAALAQQPTMTSQQQQALKKKLTDQARLVADQHLTQNLAKLVKGARSQPVR
ncbi:DUF4811 domain-containing protein [Levilactobacillus tongjiangensis]|uniref:DUF4811 domain-containing protein n=1 Tax=Levilactobacillus tongjiangensis TaxID=2486023 RepID=A0ABW1SR79_9LACO|nr:DUF4811 domain-containing protein [Levilactobacillus tongjiangensis]